MPPIVSVVIPVFNVENYLEKCLDSVIGQAYKKIEIIAINDGSTDRSPEILESYKNRFPNMKVIHQGNSGISEARNRGIEVAEGKYIYFLDSDDYILPDTIGNLVDAMETNKLDLIRFGAEPFLDGAEYKDFDRNLYDFQRFFRQGKIYEKEEFLKATIRGFSPSPCLYLLRRDLLIKNELRFFPGIMHEDELFSLQVYLNTNRAMYDPHFYYKRRYRAGSIMTSQRSQEKIKKSFDSYCHLVNLVAELYPIYRGNLERKLIKSRIRSLYIGLYYKNVDTNYKRKKIEELKGISKVEKIYYTQSYKLKNFVKTTLKNGRS